MDSQHIGVVIRRSPEEVYEFAAEPANMQRWAAGLAKSEVVREGSSLVTESPMGRVTVRFVERNAYGVLDHEVLLPSGETVYNPLRVLPHPEGAEIVFTIRQDGLDDEAFSRDAAMVRDDLARLRGILEEVSPLRGDAP